MFALHQSDRTTSLQYLDLLAPRSDPAFDRIARLARRTLGVDVVYIAFASDDLQVVRGSSTEMTPLVRSLPLANSLCQHILATKAPVELATLSTQPGLAEQTLLPPGSAGAFAGYPLRLPDDTVIGLLAAMTTEPQQWTDTERAGLADFVELTQSEIDTRSVQREAEQARREWLALLESSGQGVFGLDNDACCTYINTAAQELLGYTAEECVGRNMHWLVHARRPDGTPYPIEESLLYQSIQAGRAIHLEEKTFWHRDGRPLPVLCSCSPVLRNGVVTGAVVTVVDIRERKRVEAWQQLLAEVGAASTITFDMEQILAALIQLLVPAVADWCSLMLIDEHGQLLQTAHGYIDPEKELLLDRLFTSHGQEVLQCSPVQRVIATGEPKINSAITAERVADSHPNPQLTTLFAALDIHSSIIVPLRARGRLLGVLSLGRSRNEGLTQVDLPIVEEIARRYSLTIDNAQLYQQAQEAVLIRDQFVAIASHELRTPVTSIRGYAQLLERQLSQGKVNPERAQRQANQIVQQAIRLGALISDLLDASRFQQGRLDLSVEPVDLVALAQEILHGFQSAPEQGQQHQLQLVATGPVMGEWDRARLDQVLTNLISNAAKYSPEGGEITVEIALTPDHQAQLIVRDQGIGISTEDQQQLFKPFFRGSLSQGSIGGTGLGLYIVRQIVEGHGGTISVSSASGIGSAFKVVLPLMGATISHHQVEGSEA